jgi:hypothetical protein
MSMLKLWALAKGVQANVNAAVARRARCIVGSVVWKRGRLVCV